MALQRKNFRCLQKETRLGSSSGTTVISHAELPARSHKRVQVGNTNFAFNRSSSLPALSPIGHGPNATITCATLVDLIKGAASPMKNPTGSQSQTLHQPATRLSLSSPIVRTRQRRLTASPSEGSLHKPLRLVHTSQESRQHRITSVTSVPVQDHETEDEADHHYTVAVVEPYHCEKTSPRKGSNTGNDNDELFSERHKLYAALMTRYGSMPSVFRALDPDCHGYVSYKYFDAVVKSLDKLELKDDMQVKIWKSVDYKLKERVEYFDLFRMLMPETTASPFRPPAPGDSVDSDPCSSIACKYRRSLAHSPHARDSILNYRLKVCNEIMKKHHEQETVRGGTVKLLMHIFHQFDTNYDGYLTNQQVKDALGKGCLQLDLTSDDMDQMIRLTDHHGDEKISIKEFVRNFAQPVHDIEPDFIAENRDRETRILHENSLAQLTPREQFDPVFAQRQQQLAQDPKQQQDDHGPQQEDHAQNQAHDPPTNGTLHEALTKRIASLELIKEPVVMTALEKALADSKQSDADPLGPDVIVPVAVCQDRFQYRRQIKTDWTRVGYGKDGIRPDTALYMAPEEQFKTTNSELFQSPSRRQRADSKDSITGISPTNAPNVVISTSDFGALDKARQKHLRDARFERTQETLQEFEDVHTLEDRLKTWRLRAKAKRVAGLRFDYLENIHDQEEKVAVKEKMMQKKHGGIRFLRMWAGSPDSQFNALCNDASDARKLPLPVDASLNNCW